MRTVPEWRGKTDDAKVPPRVRLRVWLDHEGICWLSKRKIRPGEPWELEHKKALCNGGEHRETNLAPALKDKHKAKTAANLLWSEQYRVVAKDYVALKAAADLLEETKSATLAKRMSALGDMPVSRAEMTVKASDEWSDYITKMVGAREQAELKRVHLKYLEMKFMEWQSANATRRSEMRLTA